MPSRGLVSDACRIEPGIPHPEDQRRVGLAVTTPYHEDFVDELKSSLPVRDRLWVRGSEGVWWVAAAHEQLVTDLCVRHFGSVLVLGQDGESDRWVDAQGTHTQERLL